MSYLITTSFIVLDLVTGLIKALKEKNFNSSVMREGLYHKFGSLLCIVFGVMVDYAQMYIDIGIVIPVSSAICSYIVLMEIGSIIENVCAINPEFLKGNLKSYFSKLKGSDKNE